MTHLVRIPIGLLEKTYHTVLEIQGKFRNQRDYGYIQQNLHTHDRAVEKMHKMRRPRQHVENMLQIINTKLSLL